MDDERLKVHQPQTRDSHWNCEESNCALRPPVTDCGEHGEDQHSKVSDRSDTSEWHPSHVCIFAAEHGRTIVIASNVITAKMLHSQITAVRQANNGHQDGNEHRGPLPAYH